MASLATKATSRQLWVWPLLLFLLVALLFFEQRASSAQDVSLDVSLSHPAGRYDEDIFLELSTGHPDAEIVYTVDGRVPDPFSDTRYSEPLFLDSSMPQVIVVRAQAFLPDGTTGPVSSAAYFMNLDTHLPVLSIIIDPEDFWGEERGIYTNHEERGREWERPIDLTYVTELGEGFQIPAGLRIHGGWTRFFSDKKSLRLYFRSEYGAPKLNYPLFGQEGQVAFDHLILHNSSKDLLLYRNQLVERLTGQLAGYATRSQPALLFINGLPWGIYNIRELIDERLLRENIGVPAADISDTPNNRDMQSAQQLAVDTVHWENFIEFVLANDLTDPDNYTYVQTQIDLSNFVDYYLLQMYAANSDWPHHNVHQFRPRTQGGRWEWIVWDNDLAFDRVERQMVEHVLNVDHPLGDRMEIMLNKLLANPEFRNLFLTRAADLLNTDLSADNVLTVIDDLAIELAPDIDQEQARWDITADWEDTWQHMRDFAIKRPDIMRQHFVESMNLAGTVEISFDQVTAGESGWIVINGSAPQQLPWKGVFFQGTELALQAIAPAGQQFERWTAIPEQELDQSAAVNLDVQDAVAVTAHFADMPPENFRPDDVSITHVVIDDSVDIEGDWFEMRVNRAGGLDLNGWRVTDNDRVDVDDEGSLILGDDPLLMGLPEGTVVRIIATETRQNAQRFAEDGWQNGILTLYVGNGHIDTTKDPWFNLGRRDNLVLLAPGPTGKIEDDIPVGFWSNNSAVKASSFGLPPNPILEP